MDRFIEDAEKGGPVDTDKALSDDELKAGGLREVAAWVRTKQSKNALRLKRHWEKQAAAGVKQLNLPAPAEMHAPLKAMVKAAREGRDWRAAVLSDEARQVVQALERGGWKARLLRWLAR